MKKLMAAIAAVLLLSLVLGAVLVPTGGFLAPVPAQATFDIQIASVPDLQLFTKPPLVIVTLPPFFLTLAPSPRQTLTPDKTPENLHLNLPKNRPQAAAE